MINLVKQILTVIVILATAHSSAFAANKEKVMLLDQIVAVVNEGVVLQSELSGEMAAIKQRIQGSMELPPIDQLEKQVLERLIIRKLQLDEADKYGITVDDVTLNEYMRNLAASNNLTLEELRQKIVGEGENYEKFRQDIKEDMILRNLRQGLISSQIRVSEAEVDEFLSSQGEQSDFSQYLVSNIQIAITEEADKEMLQAAQDKIESIHERLRKGEDFAKVAIGESDARNALEGGDLGWHKLSELPKQFASTLRNMTPGTISKPFRMSHGFYILKLYETKGIDRQIVKQANARHILMQTDKLNNDESIRKQLHTFRKQILDGAKFSELAAQHSKDPGSAANGGELGWAEPVKYTPQFGKVIETLPVGKISQPFQSEYGWHIVEVLGWRNHDKTVEIARNTAFQELFQRKAMIEEDLWIRRLRSEAFVDIRLN